MKNTNKVYVDCFYYGFYIDESELKKYNLPIKKEKVDIKDVDIDNINKLVIKDKVKNEKNSNEKNSNIKNTRKTICSYDYSFSNIFSFLSSITLHSKDFLIEKISNQNYMMRTNNFIVHFNDEYLTIY